MPDNDDYFLRKLDDILTESRQQGRQQTEILARVATTMELLAKKVDEDHDKERKAYTDQMEKLRSTFFKIIQAILAVLIGVLMGIGIFRVAG